MQYFHCQSIKVFYLKMVKKYLFCNNLIIFFFWNEYAHESIFTLCDHFEQTLNDAISIYRISKGLFVLFWQKFSQIIVFEAYILRKIRKKLLMNFFANNLSMNFLFFWSDKYTKFVGKCLNVSSFGTKISKKLLPWIIKLL